MSLFCLSIIKCLFLARDPDELETPEIQIAITPFYCRNCKYIWDTKDNFIYHIDYCEKASKITKFKTYFDGVNVPKNRCNKIRKFEPFKGEYCLKKLNKNECSTHGLIDPPTYLEAIKK